MRAVQPPDAVLCHGHRDRRQLFDLMARGLAHRHALIGNEDVAAATALGPVLDHLIDRPRRQQRPAVTLMTVLGALLATRGVLAALGIARRIGARRTRRVARALVQLALELPDTSLKLLDAPIHPQQHLDHDLTTGIINRLRLGTLHANGFDTPRLCPPNRLNGYTKIESCRRPFGRALGE